MWALRTPQRGKQWPKMSIDVWTGGETEKIDLGPETIIVRRPLAKVEIKRFRRWERKIVGAESEEGHSQNEPIKKEFKTAHLKQKQRQFSFLKDTHGRKVPTEGDPDQVSRLFRQQKNPLGQKWKWSSVALNSSYKVKLKKKENNTTRYVWPKWQSFRYKQTASFKDTQVIRYCFHRFLSKHCLWQWTLGSLSNGENEARAGSESTKDLHLGKGELTKQNKRLCSAG